MTRRPSHSGGFTLIEVLGVVLVTAVVLGFATDYFIDLSRASNRASDNTRDIRHAAAILDRIARDFESTLLVVKPPEVDPLAHPWLFVAEARYGESGADHIKFVTRNFQPRRSQEHESDLTLVAYTVRSSEADDTLELFRWTSPQLPDGLDRSFPSEDDEAAVLLAEGLADFGVKFFDEAGDEADTWDSTTLVESSTLPLAVEISVAIADPEAAVVDRGEVVHYRRRVLLPMRPLDLALLLDPERLAGEGGEEEGDEDDAGDGEQGALRFADCFDLAAMQAAAEEYSPAFTDFAEASRARPWSEVESMIPGDLQIFVLAKPECQ
jgi:type II secretory pathway pseudopilin PulG